MHTPGTPADAAPGALLLTAAQIAARVDELAAEVAAAPAAGSGPLLMVAVLHGARFLAAALGRALGRHGLPVEVETVELRSYRGAETGGEVELVAGLRTPVAGRDLLVVEDIVSTGITASFLLERLHRQAPARLRLLTLLDQPSRRRREVDIDHRGFTIGDGFVVGYGLDLDGRWRDLPDIHRVEGPL